jgi:protein transport protein HofQ
LCWAMRANQSNGSGNEKEREKMKIRIMLLLLILSHPLWASTPKPVNLVVDDVPVVQVLQALAAQEERNLVVSPDVSGTLSLNLTRVPWRQALNTVVASAGLILREERGFFTSTPRPGSASKGA